ncbi:hypothetical protein EDB19DRAFT_1830059 [Suillus lakei]|nr:hypothetical protein EDB19DRAFT_1830059 [Suillus lakei]
MVQWYLVVVEDWPDNIPFVNLSNRHLEEDEYQKLLQEHNEKLEWGDIAEECCRTRSDKGKKHVQTSDSSQCKKSTTSSTANAPSMGFSIQLTPTTTSPFTNTSLDNNMMLDRPNFLTAADLDFGNTTGGLMNLEDIENLDFGMMSNATMSMF